MASPVRAIGSGSHSEPLRRVSSAISIRAAVTRSAAESLRIAFSQWRSTVDGLMPSRRAICFDCMWPATSRRHSRSRAVRRSPRPFILGRSGSGSPLARRTAARPNDRAPARAFPAAVLPLAPSPAVPLHVRPPAHADQPTRARPLRQRASADRREGAGRIGARRFAGAPRRHSARRLLDRKPREAWVVSGILRMQPLAPGTGPARLPRPMSMVMLPGRRTGCRAPSPQPILSISSSASA